MINDGMAPALVDRAERENALVAAALDALRALGETVHVAIDRVAARRTLEQAQPSADPLDREAWIAYVRATAPSVGLTVSPAAFSVEALFSPDARRAMPLVGLALNEEQARIVTVHEAGKRRLRVDLGGEMRWLDAASLAEALDTPADRTIPWLIGRPLTPLAPEAHHGHGHPTPFARVRSLLKLESDDVWLAVLYAAAVGIVSLILPVSVQALVNNVAFGGLLQPIVVLALVVLVGLALAGALTAAQAWVVERIQRRVFARVVVDLSHRLPRVRGELHERAHAPELVNRFFDVLGVQKSLSTLLVDGLAVLLATCVGMVILAFYHPLLLALDVALVLGLAAVVFGATRRATSTAIEESKAKYAVAAWLEEVARHPLTFKTAGGPGFATARAEDLLFGYLGARGSHFAIVWKKLAGALALQAIASAALLGLGGALVIQGKLTLGQLVASEIIVTSVVGRFAKLGKLLETTYDLLASADKLGHLVDLPLEEGRGVTLRRRSEGVSVELSGVSYAYEGGPKVLRSVSLRAAPGRRISLLGRDGSGKSTLFDVLYRLRAPTEGRVLVDDTDLRTIHPEPWREHVALVREIEVFEGTVFENVRIGRPDVTAERVREALEAVDLWREITALPDGLDTELTTGAPELSRGQACRLTLARAIAGRPRLLLIDEMLDALDAPGRRAITKRLFDRSAPWTLFVATDDPDILRAADDVLVLEDSHLRTLRAEDLKA
ncbi:MAG: ABC transporter ATP-binding protein [Polyangiaceae bacterium]